MGFNSGFKGLIVSDGDHSMLSINKVKKI